MEYEEGDGPPRLKAQRYEGESRDGHARRKGFLNETEVILYTNFTYNVPVAEEEFRLSHYGIPEPEGIVWDRHRTRWYLWFIVAAVAAFGLGAYFRYRVRRRTALARPLSAELPHRDSK